jgi:hypothetical protein
LSYELQVTSWQIITLVGFFLLYFATRLFHLTKLPIFADEAIYIRWSQIMRNVPSLRFVPLQDGKQPLFMWLTIPFLKVFNDPLLAGRMVSVFSGFFTLLGVITLPIILSFLNIRKFGHLKISLISGLIYVLAPFTFFFDRMALVDSLLAGFGIWSLNLSILLAKNKRLDIAMILGMVLGGAMLTKSPAIFFVGLSVATVVFLNVKSKMLNVKSLVLIAISLALAFMFYNILRLGPNFHMLGLRNKDYVRSVSEILSNPIQPTFARLGDIGRYYWHYLTPPLLILGVLGLIKGIKKFKRLWLVLIVWLVGPLLVQAVIAKNFTARYILFTVPVFILFSGYGLLVMYRLFGLSKNIGTELCLAFLVLLIVPAMFFDYHLWFSPAKANLPKDERAGYLEDWTAGQGISQIAQYLKSLPENSNIVVGTEGHFGTLPNGLEIFVDGIDNVTVIGIGYPVKSIPEPLIESKEAGNNTYLVVNQSRYKIEGSEAERLELIQAYEKPGVDRLLFLELKD